MSTVPGSVSFGKQFAAFAHGEIPLILLSQLGFLRMSVSSKLAAEVDLAEDNEKEEKTAESTVNRQVLDVVVHLEVRANRNHRRKLHV